MKSVLLWNCTSIFCLVILLVSAGCTISGMKLEPYYFDSGPCREINNDAVHVTFLGASGFHIKRGNDAILLAPFFSNPGIVRVGMGGEIETKRDWVEYCMNRYLGCENLQDVKGIIVGHSHYDHVMDIPYIAESYTPNAIVYGNASTRHLFAKEPFLSNPKKIRVLNLDSSSGGDDCGNWIKIDGTNICLKAIQSTHAPHFWKCHLLTTKSQTEGVEKKPKTANDWKMGAVFALIIDFLDPDTGKIDFRIHYQDSSSSPPHGFLPLCESQKTVDLAILCAASSGLVKKYPRGILNHLKPRHVLVGHWDNFFKDSRKPARTVPATNMKRFTKRLKIYLDSMKKDPKTDFKTIPEPGSCITYYPDLQNNK